MTSLKKCPICNKNIIPPSTGLKSPRYINMKTCSDSECQRTYRMLKTEHIKPKILAIKNCAYCSKPFQLTSRSPNKKFCNQKCGKQFFKERYEKNKFGNPLSKDSYLRLRFEIFKRDNFTCQYCGRNVKSDNIKLNTDHIIPRSKGGKDTAENIVTCCEECNLGKADILLTENKLRKEHNQLNSKRR